MKKINPWDELSSQFNTIDNDEIHPDVAENVLIAWPVIIRKIQDFSPNKSLRILDYGCGAGGFANELHSLGHHVVGVDSSQEMIHLAKKNYGSKIHFIYGESDSLKELGLFDVVVSIMAFQFIKDVKKTLKNIAKALKSDGLLIIAVFNPEYIVECLKLNYFFADFDSLINPKIGMSELGKQSILTYIRSASEYNSLMSKNNLTLLFEEYPPFTDEFCKKYPDQITTNASEYMILGYKKIK